MYAVTPTAGGSDPGALLLAAHRHAWRADATPLDLSLADVAAILSALVQSGSVGLVWPRLRHRADAYGAAGMALEAAYQAQVAHNAKVEADVGRVVTYLGEHGIEPVLVKGLAVARCYPPEIVRPAGDIDLVVRDTDYDRAQALLAGGSLSLHEFGSERVRRDVDAPRLAQVEIDLHVPKHWEDFPGDALFANARRVEIGGVQVAVPAPEEHIRALAFHFLRHGGVRALRLCDIALLLESRGEEFDWERCLGADPIRANWVATVAGLTDRLLGADLAGTPIASAAAELPGWLPPLAEMRLAERQVDPGGALGELAARPTGVWRVLRRRWPDPIAATVRWPVRFDRFPRLPIQWGVFLRRMGGWAIHRMPGQARALLGRR